MIKAMEISTKRYRIKFAATKCKTSKIGNSKDKTETIMNGEVLEEIGKGKVLGHIFNNKNNIKDQTEAKEDETINMMAALGISLKDNNLDKIYMHRMIILYKKCMISKLLYGLTGFSMTNSEVDKIENVNRKLIRNMRRLSNATPKVELYNEFGTWPLKYEIYESKMMMWWRIS